MRPLLIGPAEEEKIARLRAFAEANVLPLRAVQALAGATERGQRLPSLNEESTIEIPFGYFATLTCEEQPGSVCRHLSVSVRGKPGAGPAPEAVDAIMGACGFVNSLAHILEMAGGALVWQQDLGEGHFAVNVVEPLDGNIEKLRR